MSYARTARESQPGNSSLHTLRHASLDSGSGGSNRTPVFLSIYRRQATGFQPPSATNHGNIRGCHPGGRIFRVLVSVLITERPQIDRRISLVNADTQLERIKGSYLFYFRQAL